MDDSLIDSRRQTLIKLSEQIKNFGEFELTKKKVQKLGEQLEDLDLWKQVIHRKMKEEVIVEKQLQTIIETIRQDTLTIVKVQQDSFQKVIEKMLQQKFDHEEAKKFLLTKVDMGEFKREMQKVKQMVIHQMEANGNNQSKSTSTAGLRHIIKQETEKKADIEWVEELMNQRINQDLLDEMNKKIAKLEDQMFKNDESDGSFDDDRTERISKCQVQTASLTDKASKKKSRQGSEPRINKWESKRSNEEPHQEKQVRNKSKFKNQTVEKLQTEALFLKKKLEEISSSLIKQNNNYEEQMRTVHVKLEELQKNDKKGQSMYNTGGFPIQQVEVLKEKINHQLEEMKKSYQAKIDSQSFKIVTLETNVDGMTQKVNLFQEQIKKYSQNIEKDKLISSELGINSEMKMKITDQKISDLEDTLQKSIMQCNNDLNQIKQPVWDHLQRLVRENESFQRELDRHQDLYRKMFSEFQKSIDSKKSTAMIELMNETSRTREKINSTQVKYSSKLPSITFEKQAYQMKCLSHQASPRSVSEISTITRAFQEVKRLEISEEQLVKLRSSSNSKSKKKPQAKKISIDTHGSIDLKLQSPHSITLSDWNSKQTLHDPQAHTSTNFQFQGNQGLKDYQGYLNETSIDYSGQSRSPFNILKDIDRSDATLATGIGGGSFFKGTNNNL